MLAMRPERSLQPRRPPILKTYRASDDSDYAAVCVAAAIVVV